MNSQLFHKTGALTHFMIRRDRFRNPIWLVSITILTVIVVLTFTNMYANDMERQAMAETMENPAMIAMVGPNYGLANYTIGAMTANQMLLFTALAVAIMSIMIVVRHTRTDEETGRLDMIRSLPVGRLSHLQAALLVATGTNVLLALIVGFSLVALQVESIDFNGSMLYGAALAITGLFFTAVTAVFAQLSESARGVIGFSIATLLAAYLIRAVGDVTDVALSMISPLGWILRTEVYVNNFWWPIVLTLAVSVALMLLAFYLQARRDIGAGLFPAKPGRAQASSSLQSPFGLAFRLQRTTLIAWAIGVFVLAASYGSVFGDLESFFENVTFIEDLLTPESGFTLTEQFLTMIMAVMAMISAIPVIMAVNKLSGEEQQGRTEHLISRAVSRSKLMGSYLLIAVATSIIMLFLNAVGIWSAASTVMDEPISFGTTVAASFVYVPALFVMTSLALLLVGFAPRYTNLSWLYLLYSFIVVYLGGLLHFPSWLENITPFGYVPNVPIEQFSIPLFISLLMIAACISFIGFNGYRRRDLHG